jgi:CheY-like chemotaxis protein
MSTTVTEEHTTFSTTQNRHNAKNNAEKYGRDIELSKYERKNLGDISTSRYINNNECSSDSTHTYNMSDSTGFSRSHLLGSFNNSRQKQIIHMNYTHRFTEYTTADVLVLDEDNTSRALLSRYFEKLMIKSSATTQPGRTIKVNTSVTGDDTIERVLAKKESYAFITIDYFLGPDSPDGREIIRRLRKGGYKGALVYVTGFGDSDEQHLLEVGADAILFKGTEQLKREFGKLVTDLVIFNKFLDTDTT